MYVHISFDKFGVRLDTRYREKSDSIQDIPAEILGLHGALVS